MYCKCGCGSITSIAKRNRKEKGHIKGMHTPFIDGHNSNRGKKGKDHYNYKENAGYKALHLRVAQIRGKASSCKACGSTMFVEWANLTRHYEDVYDYEELCRKCHHLFDDINHRGWITRKKTALAAGIALQQTEGGGVTA